jgi:hypothetical protein
MRGKNHPDTIVIMMTLENIYEKLKIPLNQIETSIQKALTKSIVTNGEDHNDYTYCSG